MRESSVIGPREWLWRRDNTRNKVPWEALGRRTREASAVQIKGIVGGRRIGSPRMARQGPLAWRCYGYRTGTQGGKRLTRLSGMPPEAFHLLSNAITFELVAYETERSAWEAGSSNQESAKHFLPETASELRNFHVLWGNFSQFGHSRWCMGTKDPQIK